MAAAQAEIGLFSEAVMNVRKALSIAEAANRSDVVKRVEVPLAFYEQKQPFRELLIPPCPP